MALIQINQKLLHITITLLIYGVRMEKAKCPENCHCVETSVLYDANATHTEAVVSQKLDNYRRTPVGAELPYREEEVMIGLNEIDDEAEEDDAVGDVNKTMRNVRSNDIFIRNFSTLDSDGGAVVKNSKEIRVKRTSKLNESRKESGATNRDTGGPRDAKLREFFTYQITCSQARDAPSLKELPSPTTQLIIQGTHFRSVEAFWRTLRESSEKLNLLTDLSITNCALERENATEEAPDGDDHRGGVHEFLPFASLQNPKQRTAPEPPSPVSKLLLILNLSNDSLRSLPANAFQSFPNLQTLDLSGNLIRRLGNDAFAGLSNLLRLDLHGNRISSLEETVFKNLSRLLTLDLSNNSISNIAPSTFQYLTSLNTLILSDNPLSVKQQSMILLGTGKRLQIVDASKTGLKQIPGTLERSVQTLNLNGNYLSSIQCGDLDSYSLLTYLDLGRNKISYVEDDALGRLELLTNLQINENSLFQIPKSLPNNLEILNLSYNNIQNITNSDFLNLSLLKELSISYNQVSNIEENSFDNLSRLRVLDLSHNPILILPNMYGLVRLTTLNLSYFTNIPNRYSGRYEEFPAQAPETIRVLNLESSPILTRTFLQDTKTLQSFANLEELSLRFSNLTSLRKDIFGLLPKLRVLGVEGNPWHCETEILKLSEWLKSHSGRPETDADGVNTAHCATPADLHKKPLITLTYEDFSGSGGEIEKLHTGNASKNQITLKTIQEIQSKGEIYFKSFQKPIDYGDDGGIEDLSNASRGSEIDFRGGKNLTAAAAAAAVAAVTVKKTTTMTVVTTAVAPEEGKLTGVGGRTVSPQPASVISDNGTEVSGCCSQLHTWTMAATDKSGTTEDSVTSRKYELDSTPSEVSFIPRDDGTTNDSRENQPTESSGGQVTKAEAMQVKDTSSSSNLHHDAHPRLMLVTFVGAIAMATMAVTILHVAKSRKDRNYQRQTHDIEVHSISSIGNELW